MMSPASPLFAAVSLVIAAYEWARSTFGLRRNPAILAQAPPPSDSAPVGPTPPSRKVNPRSWIQTASGVAFFPNDPRPEDIDIYDIAHALSQINRFTGHTRVPYSVAEHSVRVAREIPWSEPGIRLAALLHDASEAYVADIATPVKNLPEMAAYREIESKLQRAIEAEFKVTEHAARGADVIKRADLAMLAAEKRDLMAEPPAPWGLTVPAAVDKIRPWSHDLARHEFLSEFYVLVERMPSGSWEDDEAGLPDGFDGWSDGRMARQAEDTIAAWRKVLDGDRTVLDAAILG